MALAYLKVDTRPLEWRQNGWCTEIRHKPDSPDPEPSPIQRLLIKLGWVKATIPWQPIETMPPLFGEGAELVIDMPPIPEPH